MPSGVVQPYCVLPLPQGAVSFDANGVPTQGSWTITLPNNIVRVTVTSGSLTAAILFCLGSFIGIEATTIYGEEAKDPEKTIPRATYLSILMIGIFFVFTTWLMIVGVGDRKSVV